MDRFVFVVGKGRSGTTLVRAMLTSHPDMAIPPETHFIVPLGRDPVVTGTSGVDVDVLLERLRVHPGWAGMAIDDVDAEAALRRKESLDYPEAIRTLFRLHASRQGKSRFGDKTPGHVLHMETLASWFPEAVFIHVIRDGRNVLLSNLETSFGPADVVEGASVWKRLVLSGRQSGRVLGAQRYCEVRYEDLLEQPEAEIKRLGSFAGLEYTPSMLRYFERADELGAKATHHRNLRLPPTKGLRDWRDQMSSRQLAIFEALAGDVLTEMGYELGSPRLAASDKAYLSALWLAVQARRLRWHLRRGLHRVGVGVRTT
jgi:Sulfotransferase family